LIVDGTITANGTKGNSATYGGGGGGSGGSIWVTTDALNGSGSLHADGGSSGYPGDSGKGGGDGGGGRIAVYYSDAGGFSRFVDSAASGGVGGNTGAVGSVAFIDNSVPGKHLLHRHRFRP
jgi:hypothetical protein